MHLARLSHRVKPARLLLLRDYDRKRASRPIINQEPPLSFVHIPSGTVSKLLRFVFDLTNQIRSLGLVVRTTGLLIFLLHGQTFFFFFFRSN
jgi:hypothetical protein